MKLLKSTRSLVLLLTLSLTACNLGIQGPSTINPKDQAATIVAMTLGATGQQGQQPASQNAIANTPFASPVAPATPTLTPTPAKPTLHINTNVNCRSGPGGNFKVTTSYTAGTTLELVGKNSDPAYWQVKIPNSSETCWIDAQYATPGGDFGSLPEVTPEASSQSAPVEPGLKQWNYSYANPKLTMSLSWYAKSDNVNGYRVYRSGNQVADLPANTTSYTETVDCAYGSQMTYAVEAYNNAGVSPQLTKTIPCP